MNLKKALELRKHKYIRKVRKKGKYGEWEYIYKEKKGRKKKEEKYNFLTAEQLRYTNINNFKSGDFITVDHKYVIHLKKEKYKTFSLESSVEDYKTFKPISSAFWPVYINNFLHGEYKEKK